MVDEEKTGLTNEDIAKVLKEIKDPGELAEKTQHLKRFSELSQKLGKGEITQEEFNRLMGPILDSNE